jgi:hypothetical protein
MIGVGLLDNRVAQDNFLKPLNGGGAMRSPYEGRVLFGELHQGFGNVSEAVDEGLLVAKNTKHAMDLFDSGQLLWPGG